MRAHKACCLFAYGRRGDKDAVSPETREQGRGGTFAIPVSVNMYVSTYLLGLVVIVVWLLEDFLNPLKACIL